MKNLEKLQLSKLMVKQADWRDWLADRLYPVNKHYRRFAETPVASEADFPRHVAMGDILTVGDQIQPHKMPKEKQMEYMNSALTGSGPGRVFGQAARTIGGFGPGGESPEDIRNVLNTGKPTANPDYLEQRKTSLPDALNYGKSSKK